MEDHGLCGECFALIELGELVTRHKKNKYHARCFKCRVCQAQLQGSMIERGIDMYFCLQCASNNYQARHKGHTAQSGSDARAQTTTTGSAAANPSRSPRGVPAPVSDASVLLAAEARLKRPAVPVAKAPLKAALSTSGSASSSNSSPSQSPPVGASAIPTNPVTGTAPSVTSAPIGISSPPASPLSPLYSSNSPSPLAPSVFAVAPPPPRTGSFRLQLGNAAAAAAKMAAQQRAPTTSAGTGSLASATAPSGLTFAPTTTPGGPLATPVTPPSTPVPPPFSSLHALSSPSVFATSPAANSPLRNSADRPLIGSNALRNSNGTSDLSASPAPASVLSSLAVGSTSSGRTVSPSGATIGAARPTATKRVPGTAVAALPPPPSLSGSAPLPSPLNQPRSPRNMLHTSMTPTPGPLPPPIPAPLAAPPQRAESVLDAEEERIQRELEALEREERELSRGSAHGAEATRTLPEVLTSAWLGRELVPDRPLKLQRHPNARQQPQQRAAP